MRARGLRLRRAIAQGALLGFLALAVMASGLCPRAAAQGVLTYHGDPGRSGNFVIPALTFERARSMHLDRKFQASFKGHVYAQPLDWRAPDSASGMLLIATEDNDVLALNADTGSEIWRRPLGRPVPREALSCGNIDPLGITGTPVIDAATATIYLDTMVAAPDGPRHMVFGLSLKDGSMLPGWPVDVAEALEAQGQSFISRDQNQRGALAILGDRLYVPYGGHWGDCGRYHGWIVGFPLKDPHQAVSFATRARGGGVWAPGGIATDGHALFFATGNTFGAKTWSDGEAVFRLGPDLHRPETPQDYFVAANWRELDREDADLGGSSPVLLDMPAGAQAAPYVLALGKDGRAYLLNRHDLGGLGKALAIEKVAQQSIISAAAAYPMDGAMDVAFQGPGAHCPPPASGDDGFGLTVLKIAGSPPVIETAWCAMLHGAGSPIVTTTDGRANPIVWVVGAEGDNRLHGFRGDTGEPLVLGAGGEEEMTGLHHFQTLIAANDHLYVAADGRIYAFTAE